MSGLLDCIEQGELPPWWAETPPILVLSACSWKSTGGGQRPVQLARQWRRSGREVLYISNGAQDFTVNEGVICGNWQEHLPLWLPQLEQWRGDVFCGFPAYWKTTQGRLKHWRMVLDVCDDWEEFVRIGNIAEEDWVETEVRAAFAAAGAVTYTARCLKPFCDRYGARRTVVVPNGGPEQPVERHRPPADMRIGQGINIVYCGALWGAWVDWQALCAMTEALAQEDPQGMVHVIGGQDASGRSAPKPSGDNMICYGERPYPEAMRMVAACDVMVIPFQGEALCRAVDPNKLHDAMACGVPVVATDVMEEIRGRPYVTLCRPDRLAATALVAYHQGRIPEAEAACMTAAGAWSVRAEQVASVWREKSVVSTRKSWTREAQR